MEPTPYGVFAPKFLKDTWLCQFLQLDSGYSNTRSRSCTLGGIDGGYHANKIPRQFAPHMRDGPGANYSCGANHVVAPSTVHHNWVVICVGLAIAVHPARALACASTPSIPASGFPLNCRQ